MLDELLKSAVEQQTSDIYIEPVESGDYLVKLNCPSGMQNYGDWSQKNAIQMMSIIKYRANMNITENRRPQLGRFDYQNYHIRVSTVGDFLNRETMVLRLIYALEDLDLQFVDNTMMSGIQKALPTSGLVLLSGKTGSGKTTTIHHLLQRYVNKQILTIEDPVEIITKQAVQLQVNERAEMDYESLIKVALRHRPDILFIGEIRDGKTAQATLKAALSGHLVFSTIHARSTRDVWSRLMNFEVDHKQLEAALQLVIYQQMVQRKDHKEVMLDYVLGSNLLSMKEAFSDNWRKQENML